MTELAHDYLDLDGLFSAEELELRDRVRRFVQERIKPNIAGWYEAGHFPRELVKELGTLGVLGMMRSSMIEVLHQDYIRTARAKGMPGR